MHDTFSLPPGFSGLDGAVAANGWFICWQERQAASWSPSKGFVRLPNSPESLSFGHASDEGLVLFDDSGGIGFWVWGASDWSWWASIGARTLDRRMACAGPYIVLSRTFGTTTHLRAWHASARGLEEIADFNRPGLSAIVAVALHRRSSGLVLACEDGFYRFFPPFTRDGLWKTQDARIGKPFTTRLPISGPDRSVVIPTEGFPIIVDFDAGTTARTHLAHIGGADALWRAFLADQLERVPLILDSLDHVPSTLSLGDDLLDLEVREDLVVDVATTSGIMTIHAKSRRFGRAAVDPSGQPQCSICGAPGLTHPCEAPISGSVAQGEISEILTWRGLVDQETALQEAIQRLLEHSFINDDALINAFCHFGGYDSGALILDQARGRDTSGWSFGNLYRVTRVFEYFGSRNADLIVNALRSSDPATIAIGLAGAAAPAVWTTAHPAPFNEIRSLLHHESKTIVTLAIFTCGYLELAECADDLGRILDHPDSGYRQDSIYVLGMYRSLDPKWRRRIAYLAICDADDVVRLRATEVAAQHEATNDDLESLIHGLGDTHISVRKTAATAIGKLALRLSDEQLFRVFDTVFFLLMAGHLEEETRELPPDEEGVLRSAINSIPGAMIDSLIEIIEPSPLTDLEPPEPDLPDRFDLVFLLSLFAAPFIDYFGESETEDFEDMKARYEAIDREFPLTDSEIMTMRTDDRGAPPLTILVRAMHRHGTRLAGRLAVLALFVQRERFTEIPRETIPHAETQFVPLHRKLRTTASSGGNLLTACRELVSIQADSPGINSLPALFCLAAAGDSASKRALSEKILSGEYGDVPIAPVAFMQLLNSSGKRSFLTSLLSANAVPIRIRHSVFRDWDTGAHGRIDEQPIFEFLRVCAVSEELAREDCLEAARQLAERGDGSPLEALYQNVDVTDLDADSLYEYSRDMLRGGHAEFLENIRGEWATRRDFDALEFFAAFGTAKDIPELKGALDLHQADYQIHQTIYAIQQRTDGREGELS